MVTYKDKGEKDLQDCDPSVKFLRTINALIEAMTSRNPLNVLKNDNEFYHLNIQQFYTFS